MAARVVLVHGSRLSGAQWTPLLPYLTPHVDAVPIDLPGHGVRAGEAFTLDRCADVVQEAVCAVPGGTPVVVVGHSLGGYVAMFHAARHADGLKGVVLAGCSADPVGAGAAIYRGVAVLTDRIGEDRMRDLTFRFLRRRYRPEVSEPIIASGYFAGATGAAWREVMSRCRPELLAGVECPVLLLNGQYDQFRLGESGFRRTCPQARSVVLRGATHLANLDRPRAFAEAVLRFVRDVT